MIGPRARLLAIATTVALAVAGCTTAAPDTAATPPTPSGLTVISAAPDNPSPTVAPAPARSSTAATPAPTGTRPRTAPPTRSPTSTAHASSRDVLPKIGAVTLTPADFSVPPCVDTPVRPTVTVRVTDPDDPPASLKVLLLYLLPNDDSAEVRMTYDATRKLFVYRLPAVTGPGGVISLNVTVYDHTGVRVPSRPAAPLAFPGSVCMGPPIKN